MQLRLGDQTLDCTHRTIIMGVLNVATDSPVAASVASAGSARERAAALRAAGAEIIDVGAHSTRTGGESPAAQEEMERLCPVVEALRAEGHLISVDTWTASVADAAATAGAQLINDVTAGEDPEMGTVAARHGLPLLIMHMRGTPKQHHDTSQHYDDISTEVQDYLSERALALESLGAPQVWVDPGFEFGKRMDDNLRLLWGLPDLLALGRPVVISASQKAFLAELLGYPKLPSAEVQAVAQMREATVAFNTLAAMLGVHVVRVHDVAAMATAMRVVNAARAVQPSSGG